jgi:nucleoside phosphorylase
MPHENLRAVILTALPVEFKAVRSFLTNIQEQVHPETSTVYDQGTFSANGKSWEIGIAEIGAGNAGAAVEAERAIAFFKPQVILFVGIAGGIKDVQIGDVVAATKIYGYESGKAEAEQFKPRPELGQSAYALVDRAKAEARRQGQNWLKLLEKEPTAQPKVLVAPIAAGEKVVASTKSDICQFLRTNYGDAVAVEMEGYGFLKAAYANQQRASAIVVRGISDLIDNKNSAVDQESEDVRQAKAALHASAFALQILANFDPTLGVTGSAPSYKINPQVWEQLFNCFQADDLSIIAPLCQQVFEDRLAPIELDLYSELSQPGTLSDLQKVFKRKDDLGIAVEWVGRVIHAFQQPPEGNAIRPVPDALQTWHNIPKPPQPKREPVKKSLGYLLIACDPTNDLAQVRLTAEIHFPDGTIKTDVLPMGTVCSIDSLQYEPHEHFSQVIRKAGNVKTIEVFLPWRHLHKPIHEWKVDTEIGSPKRLRTFRDTVVRSLDRLTKDIWVEEWLETLDSRWDFLDGCCQQELDQHCHRVDDLDCEVLENDLSSAEYLVLKLLSTLPEDLEDLEQLLSIVLWSGMPIWFWSYSCPPDSEKLSGEIDSLLNKSNLQDSATFATAINKQRKTLPDLGVLYDCPTRLPVLVDWKNGRLRQPPVESSQSA